MDSRDALKAGMEEEDSEVVEGCLGVSATFQGRSGGVRLVSSHWGGVRSAPVTGR
jgi:hypothetical protein